MYGAFHIHMGLPQALGSTSNAHETRPLWNIHGLLLPSQHGCAPGIATVNTRAKQETRTTEALYYRFFRSPQLARCHQRETLDRRENIAPATRDRTNSRLGST